MPCSVQGVSGSASHVPLTGTSLALSILIITGRCNPSVAASHQVDNRSAGQKGVGSSYPRISHSQPVRAWEKNRVRFWLSRR